jgi:murein DD-endopeptidase MepM/ murein hydrolase activator NlpD
MKILVVMLGLVLVILLASFGRTYKRWEGGAPEITLDRDFKALGRNAPLTLTIQDSGVGLKQVTIRLKQKEQETVLTDESLELSSSARLKTYDVGKLIEHSKIQEGEAILTVTASDHAYRNFLNGNRTELTKNFEFDLSPPRLEVLDGQHYINQGGSECVIYRVSNDVEVSGVEVGQHFFPGFPLSNTEPLVRFSLFAFAYDLPADTVGRVIARDAAGNQSVATFSQKVFAKRFRSRDIVIDDAFVEKAVADIMPHASDIKDQGETIKTFVELNSTLRRKNHDRIAQLAKESPAEFLWKDAFVQLTNSQVESHFADRRTYVYKGARVDQQDHVGFDLSVVQHYPIEAANDGKVILAEYFGIYGNTVMIDHGAGLISLYGHLSSIDVQPGKAVKKKDILGRSGATGMAGGDHLHFGLFLQGVPINPTEWWDQKWINDHVLDRLKIQQKLQDSR